MTRRPNFKAMGALLHDDIVTSHTSETEDSFQAFVVTGTAEEQLKVPRCHIQCPI